MLLFYCFYSCQNSLGELLLESMFNLNIPNLLFVFFFFLERLLYLLRNIKKNSFFPSVAIEYFHVIFLKCGSRDWNGMT